EILINISETKCSKHGDKKLSLQAESFEPKIYFNDFERIFHKHFICRSLSEFESPPQMYAAHLEISRDPSVRGKKEKLSIELG
ncbi:hypothetical protein L9F63_025637, partial [Diploptera punctata]